MLQQNRNKYVPLDFSKNLGFSNVIYFFSIFFLKIDIHHETEGNIMLYEHLRHRLYDKTNHKISKINLPIFQELENFHEKNSISKDPQFNTFQIRCQFPKSVYGPRIKNLRTSSSGISMASPSNNLTKTTFYSVAPSKHSI